MLKCYFILTENVLRSSKNKQNNKQVKSSSNLKAKQKTKEKITM